MKQIEIMGCSYEIIQVTPAGLLKAFDGTVHMSDLKEMFGNDCKNFSGLCDAQLLKIYINIELPLEKKKKTLLHEIVEAIDQESLTELCHIQMQSIANAFFLSGILDVEGLLKLDPEDIEISIISDSTPRT